VAFFLEEVSDGVSGVLEETMGWLDVEKLDKGQHGSENGVGDELILGSNA
jgi:hypothetical protein